LQKAPARRAAKAALVARRWHANCTSEAQELAMNRRLVALGFACASAGLVFATTGAAANEENKADFSNTVTVREVHPQEARIVVDDEGQVTQIYADGSTTLFEGSRAIRLEDLAPGERVTVDADFEKPTGSGRLIADRIVVVSEPEDM
jgi:hypothetical protein